MTTMPPMLLLLPILTYLMASFLGACCDAFTPSLVNSHHTPVKKASSKLFGSETSGSETLSRRQFAELSLAGAGALVTAVGTVEVKPTDYGLWGILPVGPYKTKQTHMETIVPDSIYTFDQKFGILNVQVPLRMTAVVMDNGGLLLYNPVASTKECLDYVRDLIEKHGPIKHIVVGSVALEHKVYASQWAQKFTEAQVWLTPGQYSVPVNLPESFLGFPPSRTRNMPYDTKDLPAELQASFEHTILGPIISRDGAFGETALYHKPTKTLIVTDTAVEVSPEVPTICSLDPAPLLYHARDTVTDVVENTPETRAIGWRRIVLFGLYFNPGALDIKDAGTAWKERRPDINSDFLGVYPWDWVGDGDVKSFNAISGGLLVAPILQVLLLNRSPVEVLDFADRVAKWDIERIIPAHLKNNLKYNGADFRRAFTFLEEAGEPAGQPKPLPEDLKLLQESEDNLIASGAIAPTPPLPGGKFSRAEIIAKTTYRCRRDVCEPQAPVTKPN